MGTDNITNIDKPFKQVEKQTDMIPLPRLARSTQTPTA